MTQPTSTPRRKATRPRRRMALVVSKKTRPRRRHASRRGRALIDYIISLDGVNTLFDRIIAVLQPAKHFFNQVAQLVAVQTTVGVVPVTSQNLNGYLSTYLEIRYLSLQQRGLKQERLGLLSRDFTPAFLSSPRVIDQFPRLVHYTRVPTFDTNWRRIAAPGYHAGSGIYYDGPKVRPRRGTRILAQVLGGFCWKTAIDRVNYLGLLLTAVTMLHWIGKHPLAIFSNVPRLGKSLLARIVGLVIDGRCTSISFLPNDEEFERQISTSVDMDDHVVNIDNAKSSHRVPEVSSSVLERCVTDLVLNFRRLRTNRAIRRPNDVIFCLTMNTAKMGLDLRLRGLPINLFYAGKARGRHFTISDLEAFVLAHRFELVAELLGMVQRWVKAGHPIPQDAATHTVSQGWAATIDGILRANGYDGFLSNFDQSEQEFDVDYAALLDVCAAFHNQSAGSATTWAKTLRGSGQLGDRLNDADGRQRTEQGMATVIGNLFNPYTGSAGVVRIGR